MTRCIAQKRTCPARVSACRVALLLVALLAAAAAAAHIATPAYADSGTVYSCTVHPTYEHPVTGAIEDSGGSSSAATGQAMVESCMYSEGMMEVTSSGACYLTVRLSLIDFTSGHDFQVQDWGASGWSVPALGVTATGSDSNGTTNDVCIELPSELGIVRVSMFVDSMGRDVVFYAYADDLSEGVPSDFTPAIVTEEPEDYAPDEAAGDSGDDAADVAAASETPAAAAPAASASAGADSAQGSGAQPASQASGDAAGSSASASTAASAGAASATGEAGASSADDLVDGTGASSAQGLSLSTAPDEADAGGTLAGSGALSVQSVGTMFLIEVAAVVLVVGIVLMLVAACIVYVFRRNWSRWGGYDPDDYSGEYRNA